MKFTKMHGCGNDYVYVNAFQEHMDDESMAARIVSDRHFGVGGDGMIVIAPSQKADFEMRMYNADGTRAEMCGNGIRCVGKYVYDFGLTDKTELTVESMGAVKYLTLHTENGKVKSVRVDMGAPVLQSAKVPVVCTDEKAVNVPVEVLGQSYRMTCVSMGNPHCVVFMDTPVQSFPLETVGPAFEHHPCFPQRVNAEFVQVLSRTELDMRVWERGTGETLACGTGACAVAVAGVLNGLTANEVTVHLLGGDLQIAWSGSEKESVYMTGPAETVFSGEIDLDNIIQQRGKDVENQ